MPFNAQGVWVNEDDDVVSQLNQITSQNSPLMQQAAQQGANFANKRGLLNSSIASGASQAAVLERAAPIAQANAQIRAQRNITGMGIEAQRGLLGMEIASREKIAGQDITAQMQRLQLATDAEMKRLQAQLTNANAQQQVEIKAQMDRLNATNAAEMARLREQGSIQGRLQRDQFGYQVTLNNQQNLAELTRLREGLRSTEGQQKADIAAQMARLVYGTNAQVTMQAKELASRQLMQSREFAHLTAQQKTDIAARIQLADMEIDAQASMQGRQLTSEEKRQALELQTRQIMQSAEFDHLDEQQKAEIAARMALSTAQISSTERLAGQEIESREGMLGLELASRQQLQTQQLAAEEDRLALELASRETLLSRQLDSTELQQLRDITSRQGLLTQELDAQFRNLQFSSGEDRSRLQMTLANELQRAQLASQTALTQTGMEAEARLQQIAATGNVEINLQQLRNLSDQQKTTLASFVDFNNQYATSLNNLFANKDMPQPTRDAAIAMFTQLRNANIDYAKVVWNVDMDWGTPGTTTPTPTAPTTPLTGTPTAPTPLPSPGSTDGEFAPDRFAPAPTPQPVLPDPLPSTQPMAVAPLDQGQLLLGGGGLLSTSFINPIITSLR